jgi:hypothetical protein
MLFIVVQETNIHKKRASNEALSLFETAMLRNCIFRLQSAFVQLVVALLLD